jgi:uncharacterized peroxidase-related enzyme
VRNVPAWNRNELNRKSSIVSRITALSPAEATGKAKRLLDAVQSKLGLTPNLTRVMANSPAVLEAYLNFSDALASGTLGPAVRQQIALTVAEVNLCAYCLSAHTVIGGMVGLKPDTIARARNAGAADSQTDAILKLARAIVVQRGEISEYDFDKARQAGITDGEIAEVVANVALNILTNYLNHVAQTDIDFPKVEPGVESTSGPLASVKMAADSDLSNARQD